MKDKKISRKDKLMLQSKELENRAIRWWNVIDDDIDQLIFSDIEVERYKQTKRYLTREHLDDKDYKELTINDVIYLYKLVFHI